MQGEEEEAAGGSVTGGEGEDARRHGKRGGRANDTPSRMGGDEEGVVSAHARGDPTTMIYL